MNRLTFRLSPLAAALTLATGGLAAPLVQAAESPAYAITGSPVYVGDFPVTVGFVFTAEQDVSLTALGFHDNQLDGLGQAHDVALYTTTGTLLALTSVAAGTSAPLIGEYRYATLASAVTLQSGTQYVVAAQTDTSDGYRYATLSPTLTLSVNPLISIGNQAGLYHYGPSLTFPQSVGYDIYATPNMLLAAVPEPGTWALMAAGLLAVGGLARRRPAKPGAGGAGSASCP